MKVSVRVKESSNNLNDCPQSNMRISRIIDGGTLGNVELLQILLLEIGRARSTTHFSQRGPDVRYILRMRRRIVHSWPRESRPVRSSMSAIYTLDLNASPINCLINRTYCLLQPLDANTTSQHQLSAASSGVLKHRNSTVCYLPSSVSY